MKNKVLVSLFLICVSLLSAKDCVPLTFAELSTLAKSPVPYSQWMHDLGIKVEAPYLEDSILAWNRRLPKLPLVCVYSVMEKYPDRERPLILNVPYIWIGIVPEKLKVDPREGGPHCALVYFREDFVHIVSPVKTSEGGEIIYYIEQLEYGKFFSRTLVIYEVVPTTPLVWSELPPSLFK